MTEQFEDDVEIEIADPGPDYGPQLAGFLAESHILVSSIAFGDDFIVVDYQDTDLGSDSIQVNSNIAIRVKDDYTFDTYTGIQELARLIVIESLREARNIKNERARG